MYLTPLQGAIMDMNKLIQASVWVTVYGPMYRPSLGIPNIRISVFICIIGPLRLPMITCTNCSCP